ncbi:energy transducer TonB [Mangrovibacterium diazotrophicum]|uniref:Protein TonB n=1 Tax=Mangrovibacterium diazotrophicum TaxID=1261403 RepID=A0A419WB15_9BACT|nr:energy transducer TonB [Mangrovibacterium diazotrophicum]RKD92658.1 protein TonB [Mangrovibacterium diazotrophicum]
MKTKKSPKADLEKNRSLFFSVGLVLALGLVLAAFSVKTEPVAIPETGTVSWDPPEEIIIPITRPEEKKKELPVVSITEIVVDLEAGQEELDMTDFTSEASEGELFEVNPVLASTPPEVEEEIMIVAQEMPEFPGGMKSLMAFIGNSLKYPVLAQENCIYGKVYVRFVVNKDGSIADAMVVRPVNDLLDKEALRVVSSMPKWKPGMQNGKPVRVMYTVPINFVLQ